MMMMRMNLMISVDEDVYVEDVDDVDPLFLVAVDDRLGFGGEEAGVFRSRRFG